MIYDKSTNETSITKLGLRKRGRKGKFMMTLRSPQDHVHVITAVRTQGGYRPTTSNCPTSCLISHTLSSRGYIGMVSSLWLRTKVVAALSGWAGDESTIPPMTRMAKYPNMSLFLIQIFRLAGLRDMKFALAVELWSIRILRNSAVSTLSPAMLLVSCRSIFHTGSKAYLWRLIGIADADDFVAGAHGEDDQVQLHRDGYSSV